MVEFLLLANHVEAVNGLLYAAGGGWSDHWRGPVVTGQPPPQSSIGIAVSILVPWTETNRRHRLLVRVESEDGGEPLVRVEGDLEVGRPTGIPSGTDQRSILALNAGVAFPAEGGYRVIAELGESQRSVSFRVHNQPLPGN